MKLNFVFSEDLQNFESITLNEKNLMRITIYPGIWVAFQGLKKPFSIVNNVADIIHNEVEIERKNLNEVNYFWGSNYL